MDSPVILKFVPNSTSTSGMWTSLVKVFLSLLYLKVNVASCCFTPGKYNVLWLFTTMEFVRYYLKLKNRTCTGLECFQGWGLHYLSGHFAKINMNTENPLTFNYIFHSYYIYYFAYIRFILYYIHYIIYYRPWTFSLFDEITKILHNG